MVVAGLAPRLDALQLPRQEWGMRISTEWSLTTMEWHVMNVALAAPTEGAGLLRIEVPRIQAEAMPAPSAEGAPGLNLTMEAVVGSAVSFSLALWMARGGSLLASLLTSSPLWVRFDLLPVLERPRLPGTFSRATDRGVPANAGPGGAPAMTPEERFFAALPPSPPPAP